jgi:hypothetical protein
MQVQLRSNLSDLSQNSTIEYKTSPSLSSAIHRLKADLAEGNLSILWLAAEFFPFAKLIASIQQLTKSPYQFVNSL